MNASATLLKSSMPHELFGYEILESIGDGAGSRIYAAVHPKTKQLCAVKHVICTDEKDQRFVEQLKSELAVGQRVNHPGLRKSLDFQVNKTWLGKVTDAILVLELFDGIPLDRELPPTLPGIVEAFIQVAAALHSLHQLGFVHCDLKPANILRAADGAIKVIDLGQGCPFNTRKPRIQGTPDFISPEQVRCDYVTVRTDVFNFGATLYWCLCGQKLPTLFTVSKGENSFLLDTQIASPRDINPDVPENLSNLVMECVRTKAEKRPADLQEVGRRLEVVLYGMRRPAKTAMAV